MKMIFCVALGFLGSFAQAAPCGSARATRVVVEVESTEIDALRLEQALRKQLVFIDWSMVIQEGYDSKSFRATACGELELARIEAPGLISLSLDVPADLGPAGAF